MKNVSFVTDLFSTTLLHVIFCDTELGTIEHITGGFSARTPNGSTKLCTTQDGAAKWLLDYHNKPIQAGKVICNQFSIF